MDGGSKHEDSEPWTLARGDSIVRWDSRMPQSCDRGVRGVPYRVTGGQDDNRRLSTSDVEHVRKPFLVMTQKSVVHAAAIK